MGIGKKEKFDKEIPVEQTHENNDSEKREYEEIDEWKRLEKWRPGRRNFA